MRANGTRTGAGPVKKCRRGSVVASLGMALLSILLPITAGPAAAQTGDAIDATDKAAKMIQEDRLVEAVAQLDRVIDKSPDYWEAHYQRGRALALMDRMEEARDALLRAVSLNPGFAHGHYLAWLAAFNLEDYRTAWEQAISAELAGLDMSEQFPKLVAVSETPDDVLDRLGAPRVFVAPFNTADIEGRAELPYNRNPNAAENRISRRPDAIQGAFRLQEAAPELLELHRQIRIAVQRAPYLGLTLDPGNASVYVKLTIDTIGERSPRRLAGTLAAIAVDTGQIRWQREIVLRDISSVGAIMPQIERYIREMQGEIRHREPRQQ